MGLFVACVLTFVCTLFLRFLLLLFFFFLFLFLFFLFFVLFFFFSLFLLVCCRVDKLLGSSSTRRIVLVCYLPARACLLLQTLFVTALSALDSDHLPCSARKCPKCPKMVNFDVRKCLESPKWSILCRWKINTYVCTPSLKGCVVKMIK